MHIGFITSHFPFKNATSVGGIGTSIKNLSVQLLKMGHSVSVFVYNQSEDENIIDDGVKIYKIKNIKLKGFSRFFTRKKIQKKINSISNQHKIDIVEAPDWEGITSFINLKCPIIIRLNGSDAYFCHIEKRENKWINKFHEKRAFKKANAIIAVSKFTGNLTNKIFKTNRIFEVIPNGVDVDEFSPIEEDVIKNSILYFGGVIRKKGVLEIPHYFNLVIEKKPDSQLIIAGKDMFDVKTNNESTTKMMKDIFTEKALAKTIFIGSVPYNEIKMHIAKATICIFPSYAEALPVSWIEAMALEKAIVASNIGWSNEIIDDEIDGFKVNPKNHQEFANKIIKLLDDDQFRLNLQKNARIKIIQKFSTKVTANKTLEFYNKFIN